MLVSKILKPDPGVCLGKFTGLNNLFSSAIKSKISLWSHKWLPVVMQSTPDRNKSLQISSVIPNPPAEFSPLTIAKSIE